MNLTKASRQVDSVKYDLEEVYKQVAEKLKDVPGSEKVLQAINNSINEAADLSIRVDDAVRERV